jgi:site-specific recombinase XerD
MTLSGLHQKFLRYCEGERRLSPQTVVAYRSDFLQFVEALRAQSRWGLMRQDVVGTLSLANVRLYQYAMAEQGASRATVQRRLVSLNCFGRWLVRYGHLAATRWRTSSSHGRSGGCRACSTGARSSRRSLARRARASGRF